MRKQFTSLGILAIAILIAGVIYFVLKSDYGKSQYSNVEIYAGGRVGGDAEYNGSWYSSGLKLSFDGKLTGTILMTEAHNAGFLQNNHDVLFVQLVGTYIWLPYGDQTERPSSDFVPVYAMSLPQPRTHIPKILYEHFPATYSPVCPQPTGSRSVTDRFWACNYRA